MKHSTEDDSHLNTTYGICLNKVGRFAESIYYLRCGMFGDNGEVPARTEGLVYLVHSCYVVKRYR